MKISKIYLATLTKNSSNAGSDSPIVLTISKDGQDLVYARIHESRYKGKATLSEIPTNFDYIESDWLEKRIMIRITITGDDQWSPEHILVWGETDTGEIIPLGFAKDMTVKLSTEADEGQVSWPMKSVTKGTQDFLINYVLMIIKTKSESDSGTDSKVQLKIIKDVTTLVDYWIPDSPQDDLETSSVNMYLTIANAFKRRKDPAQLFIRLIIHGQDLWRPSLFYLFGYDSSMTKILPLVSKKNWSEDEYMSTDSEEGKPTVLLPVI